MKKNLLLSLVLMLAIILVACSPTQSDTTDGAGSEFDLLESGKLTWASSGLYKPFNYKEG